MSPKRLFKVSLIILTSFFVLSISILVLNEEIRSFVMFKTAPGYTKKVYFLKFKNNPNQKLKQEIYLLGTIHADHLKTKKLFALGY